MAPLPPRASPTVEAILAAYEIDAGDGWREHLGASVIGRECDRALWYEFRWVTRAAQSGRMLRLFETGRLEEERLIRNLRRIGVTVLDVDPDTGRQWHVQAHGRHFGGSLDGVGLSIPEAPKTWHVLEFKTHNAKSFAELKQHGVRKAKPEHWCQMQVYMHLTGLTRALYLAVCKDTDALHAERVRDDHEEAERLIARAGRIIFAPRPPARISDDPDWFQCRLCPHHDVCHGDRVPARTCRGCLHVTPAEDGAWHCARFDRAALRGDHQGRPWEPAALSPDEQRAGCGSHLLIPDLIQGEQIDADPDGAWVAYLKPDGSVWRDGAA
jgi:PD-(D/E)XK nuclease superfamily